MSQIEPLGLGYQEKMKARVILSLAHGKVTEDLSREIN